MEQNNLTPELEDVSYNYMLDDKGNLYVRVVIDNVLFTRTNEKIKLNVFVNGGDWQVLGKAEVFDPISRQRIAFQMK